MTSLPTSPTAVQILLQPASTTFSDPVENTISCYLPSNRHTLTPILISFALPIFLRIFRISLVSYTLFAPLALVAIFLRKIYHKLPNTDVLGLYEHIDTVSYAFVCLFAHIFVRDVPTWKGEVLYWSIYARWASRLHVVHQMGINALREAYTMRFGDNGARLQASLIATLMTVMFLDSALGLAHVVVIWLHFYNSFDYVLAVGTYICLNQGEKDLMESWRRREQSVR